ncbi:5-formyltetrahydrofolate cyclo-ligase [Candidatus Woesearchaeota archaeon]|nr:5-formyltetrahydrofolate cyclo-ligase [Candidatus Woesearchaeota archaeon]
MATGPEKKQLRKEQQRAFFTGKRNSMEQGETSKKSAAIQERFSGLTEYSEADTIMLYWATGNEVSTKEAIRQALELGKRVVLPVTNPGNNELVPVQLKSIANTRKGAFGITEPIGEPVEPGEIDIIVVPVVAFDEEGDRIGRGLGYYDRFLKKTRCIKVGFAYDFQKADNVPQEEHDVRLDKVVTETRVIECRR